MISKRVFAYGEFLKEAVLRDILGRVPSERPAILRGHRSDLDPTIGFYTVVPSPLDTVEGLMLEGLREEDLRAVDAFEGVGEDMYHRAKPPIEVEGRATEAQVYVRSSKIL